MHGDIPAVILKGSIEIYLNLITELINNSFCKRVFPKAPKFAIVSPTFKKNGSLNKKNYRPVSVL